MGKEGRRVTQDYDGWKFYTAAREIIFLYARLRILEKMYVNESERPPENLRNISDVRSELVKMLKEGKGEIKRLQNERTTGEMMFDNVVIYINRRLAASDQTQMSRR